MRRIIALAGLALLCAAPTASATGGAAATRASCATRSPTKGILAHEAALQAIGPLAERQSPRGHPRLRRVGALRRRARRRRRPEGLDTPRSTSTSISSPTSSSRSCAHVRRAADELQPRHRRRRSSAATSARCTARSRPTSRPRVWAADINAPATGGAEQQHERLRGRGLCGHAQARSCSSSAAPAPFLREVHARRDRPAPVAQPALQRGPAGPPPVPLWFDVTGLQVPWAAILRRDRRPRSPTASIRASQALRCASSHGLAPGH